jgi:hypothetical protein
MANMKLVSKIALFFGVVSVIFTVILAVITYLLLQVSYSTPPPADYAAFLVLSTILPYLFIAVLSLVVSALSRGHRDETASPPLMQSPPETA